MKCPGCGVETQYSSEGDTLVGYDSPPGHQHDDNCRTRYYICENRHEWTESIIRRCNVCDWTGKRICSCHESPKVEQWTDPERVRWNS